MTDTPAKIEYSDKDKPSKTPIVLAVAVGIVAAAVSVWGINNNALMAGVPSPSPALMPPSTLTSPASEQETERLVKAGAALHQERCAGCHTIESKLVGPAYVEISAKYRSVGSGAGIKNPEKLTTAALLSDIGYASTHPKNDWDGYDDGPHLHLDKEQQRAIAVWILNSTKDKEVGND